VRETGAAALKAMHAMQDRCGFFRHILDDEFSRFEASSTLMYAYAVAKAVKLGLVGPDMIESAVRAFEVVADSVQEDGAVPGVAVQPGGPGVPFGHTLFAQGFLLLAAHALQDHLTL
jgi:unsaturated rhamnogalacturonyl hydrolase